MLLSQCFAFSRAIGQKRSGEAAAAVVAILRRHHGFSPERDAYKLSETIGRSLNPVINGSIVDQSAQIRQSL